MHDVSRRRFLGMTTAALVAASLPLHAQDAKTAASRKLKKGVKASMLPNDLPFEQQFALAKKCGFEGIDADRLDDLTDPKKYAELARAAGIPIHGVVFGGWKTPLSSPDPEVQKKGVEGMQKALRDAKAMEVDTVLLVPAIVTDEVSYGDAYKRSQENIRKLIPTAEETGVTIAVENVWNKFLLSPLEFARYIDEFESPRVKAYYDIGNVILFGFSQDWIRTLGKRIVKLDVKDFKRDGSKWVNLLDGDVNWPEVLKAIDEIGYQGWITAELPGGDEEKLTEIATRLDKIIKGDVGKKA